jgi:hypothetical protein
MRCRVHALFNHFLGPSPRAHCGTKVEAKLLGVSRYTMPLHLSTLAGAVMESSKCLLSTAFSHLSQKVRDGSFEPIAAYLSTCYDETPCSIRVEDLRPPLPDSKRAKVRNSRKPQVAKVLQTDAFLMLLLRKTTGGFISFRIPVPCSLQVEDHSTAENLKRCIEDIWSCPGLSEFLALFPSIVHMSCHDRAASNMKYEACMLRDSAPHELRLDIHCDVHKVSRSAKFVPEF